MAKVTYASLKLKTNTDVKTFDFNGSQIDVLQYLPIEDKYSLLNITLQEAKEDGIYNPLKKDMYFHLNLVFMYSNISFTEKQKEDMNKLYDAIESSGLMNKIIENIPEEEYQILYELLLELEESLTEYKRTFTGVVSQLIDSIPARADEINEILENFDTSKFQEVVDFARAANNNQNIK